ncbi:hypothetical protein C1T17_20825 (plasmid) [Sphingobium sp. SCG-1]|uniref:alpha/beta fold hydrolase n=1 Tax=Sphingobium sp. SCG-1 TaxID=2072936 RepID=UPI000CD6BFA8|nr:alpha/beta fold hydrolase [Sphingobium sp. SCG-1]AUW60648.1 hypothetical protein C1T17_20825 [Sphingobium sp. SCG-1]
MHESSPWHPDGTGNIDAAVEPPASKRSPIVHFAHATGLNAQTYQPLLERFSCQFRVAAWDMRGHGHSPLPAINAGFEGWETLERDLEEVVVKLGEKVHLVGHSIGATLSIMLAARRPDIVASVAALEPSSISYADRLQVEICRAQGGYMILTWRARLPVADQGGVHGRKPKQAMRAAACLRPGRMPSSKIILKRACRTLGTAAFA